MTKVGSCLHSNRQIASHPAVSDEVPTATDSSQSIASDPTVYDEVPTATDQSLSIVSDLTVSDEVPTATDQSLSIVSDLTVSDEVPTATDPSLSISVLRASSENEKALTLLYLLANQQDVTLKELQTVLNYLDLLKQKIMLMPESNTSAMTGKNDDVVLYVMMIFYSMLFYFLQ